MDRYFFGALDVYLLFVGIAGVLLPYRVFQFLLLIDNFEIGLFLPSKLRKRRTKFAVFNEMTRVFHARENAALTNSGHADLLLLKLGDYMEVVELRVDFRPKVDVSVLAYLAYVMYRGSGVGLVSYDVLCLARDLLLLTIHEKRGPICCVALRKLWVVLFFVFKGVIGGKTGTL